ncbi:MAG: hypothetical protein NZ777_07490, partial [Pseudomonadales bacterium]|nr:hypothetical protein [Pseudomonadales bacterium]
DYKSAALPTELIRQLRAAAQPNSARSHPSLKYFEVTSRNLSWALGSYVKMYTTLSSASKG